MKKLCTILARGGSKGVPNKNIRDLGGKPLIAYTIASAQSSGFFDDIAVSSDSREILKVAADHGVQTLIERPAALATDQAPKLPAIQHCAQEAEKRKTVLYDIICDLDPTSPFRSKEDIAQCLHLIENAGVSNVITGATARKSPYFNLVEVDKNGFAKLSHPSLVTRRQDAPLCYDMNASIYVWRRASLMGAQSVFQEHTVLYEMPRERSLEIDTELDFEIVSALVERKGSIR